MINPLKYLLRQRNIVESGEIYMRRWEICRLPWLVVYIHEVRTCDTPDFVHNHPGSSISVPIAGEIQEYIWCARLGHIRTRILKPGRGYYRHWSIYHRLDLYDSNKRPLYTPNGADSYWSLFIGWNWTRAWHKISQLTGEVFRYNDGFKRKRDDYVNK